MYIFQQISKELQSASSAVFNCEEAGQSERESRMANVHHSVPPPRSLTQLTGTKNIFAHLHSHFCWLLWGGARYLVEQVTIGSPIAPPWLGKDTEEGFTLIHVDKEEWLLRKKFGAQDNARIDSQELDMEIIQELRHFFSNHRESFISLLYCCLIGIQVSLFQKYKC